MSKYKETQEYWNKVFSNHKDSNPNREMADLKIENGIKWLVSGSQSLIDFGCGSGEVLLRSMALGVENGLGIDISCSAINLAKETTKQYKIDGCTDFQCGGLSLLRDIESSSFDGAILFNIIDAMYPTDAMEVIKVVHKKIKSRGKVLLKLKPYIIPDKLDKNPCYRRIMDNFYFENSGYFLWNLSDEDIEDFLNPYFIIEEEFVILSDNGTEQSRLIYLRAM